MAVGLVVDYMVHIVHYFLHQVRKTNGLSLLVGNSRSRSFGWHYCRQPVCVQRTPYRDRVFHTLYGDLEREFVLPAFWRGRKSKVSLARKSIPVSIVRCFCRRWQLLNRSIALYSLDQLIHQLVVNYPRLDGI